MLATLLAAIFAQDSLTQRIDELAKRRDVSGLTGLVAQGAWVGRSPIDAIRTNGAYETGKYGWSAVSGTAPNGKRYIVLTTALTSEDIGERLFETDGQMLTKYVNEKEDFGWRIERHNLSLDFDIPSKSVHCVDKMILRQAGTAQMLMFRMGPNYRVKTILKGTEAPKWIQLGGIVMVGGVTDGSELTVTYDGVVDKPGYAGAITPNEAMLTNDYWYPMVARKPSPYNLKVAGPPMWTVVGQGEALPAIASGNKAYSSFRMELPITYWSLNLGPYKVVEETIGGRRYKCWSKTLTDDQMRLQPKFFPAIIDTYEAFGKFPFSGYGSCVTPLYGGGALEAYSFVTSGYYSGEDSHEVGHTWFGGMVDNTYLTSLWNESFADWCTGYYSRNVKIGNREERELAFIQTPGIDEVAYFAAPLNDSPPDIGPASSTLGYGKGAYVLQMLEQELGTETMVKACRDWIEHQDKTRGAEWEDFEAAVKRVSPKDMTWFFDQWVRRPGFARFRITNVKWANGQVTGSIANTGEPYKIHADVLLQGSFGKRWTTVELAGASFSIPCDVKPSLVSIDPWRRIVRKIDESEEPVSLSTTASSMDRINTLQGESMLLGFGGKGKELQGSSMKGQLMIGSPELDIRLKPLYDKVGFLVKGSTLAYKGTTIDLNKGGAMAIVDLADGTQCAIGIGKVKHMPNFGRARLAVFDELGRFLRGVTEPKTSGLLTYRP